MSARTRVAFVKFGGLAAGGTERWLQTMAVNLPRDRYEVTYFYSDTAPFIGHRFEHSGTDPYRLEFMESSGISLVEFQVGAVDHRTATRIWRETDFWELFDPARYDLVQTAKSQGPEYPFEQLSLPVVSYIPLPGPFDPSPNCVAHLLASQMLRRQWFRNGGDLARSDVIPVPVDPPATDEDLRSVLGLDSDAVIAGFHQRVDDAIYSQIPLDAFSSIATEDSYFLIMGGSERYRSQARALQLDRAVFIDHSADAGDISRFLNTLDVFAHGRRDGETFGTVLAEAMVHSKPCLSHASPTGNNAQVETMGPGGLFGWSASEYEVHLRHLLTDSDLRKRLATKGAAHARDYYKVDGAVAHLARIYDNVLDGRPPASDQPVIPYAYMESLGLLYAGRPEEPGLPHYTMTGGVPEAFDVHMCRLFFPAMESVWDIGANTGLYCLVAAQDCPQGSSIHAFEPQADACTLLAKTLALNNWDDRVAVHELGLGSSPGELVLHLAGTGSSFDPDFNSPDNLPTVRVPVDSVDNQKMLLRGKAVSFVKIDVEGFELEVLKGAEQTIGEDTPVLFIEIADVIAERHYRNPRYAETLDWLTSRNYEVWRCSEPGRLSSPDSKRGFGHPSMYLCLHITAHSEWIARIHPWAKRYRLNVWKARVRRARRLLGKAGWALSHPGASLRHIREFGARAVLKRVRDEG